MTPPDEPTLTPPEGPAPGGGASPRPDEPGYPHGAHEEPAIETAVPPENALKLKDRVVPDPPELDQGQGRRAFWFVLALLVVAAVVMGAVLALNVIADPYGSVGMHLLPTVTTSDRTVKADRIEALEEGPQLVVLGSSRSMRYEPAYLQELTGLRTFNAGVNGIGGTADAWAMTQFIHEVWPDSRPAYLWMVDVESFVPFEVQARTANEPRLARYVGAATAGKGPVELAKAIWQNRTTEFSLDTAKDSLRLLLYKDKAKNKQSKYQKQILADGVLKQRLWSKKEWDRRYPNSVQRYSDLYKNVYHRLDPASKAYFEKTLAFMNAQGATPVLVITPINPKLAKVLDPLGRAERHRQVVDYVESLQGKYSFKLVDLTDPSVFGFDPKQFYDGMHMTTINTEKAVDHILKQTGGVPPVQTPASGQ
jgi:IS5 family transposase